MLAFGRLAPWFRARRSALFALALCALGYAYASPYFPALNNPNENVRVHMTAALVEHGTYRIDRIRARWGWTNDAACVDRDARGHLAPCNTPAPPAGMVRHFYSVKAPLGSVLAMPAYAALRYVRGDATTMADAVRACRIGGSILPVLALLWFVRRYFESDLGGEEVAVDTSFFALALGSVLFGYGLLFLSHSQSALVAFVAFARLSLAKKRGSIGWLDAALAGLFASSTTALEYPCLFITAALCVMALFCVRPLPRIVAFGLGALLPVILVMHFQKVAFGSPFRPGHLFVENPGFRVFHQQGFFGADGLHVDAATRLLVDPKLGLFTTTPFFVLAAIGAIMLLRDRARRLETVVAIACCVLLYGPVVLLSNWDGGWVIGPRYLVAIFPFVAWLAAHGVVTLRRAEASLVSIPLGLLLASLVVSGIESTYYPHLPPEIRAPLADLYFPLIRAGYAPANVGLSLGLPMARSMLPLAVLGVAIWIASARSLGLRAGAKALALALPIALVGIAPSLAVSDVPPPIEQAQRFIERTWDPPRDAAR